MWLKIRADINRQKQEFAFKGPFLTSLKKENFFKKVYLSP